MERIENPQPASSPGQGRPRKGPGTILFGLLVAAVLLAAILLIFRDRTPALDSQTLEQARQRWTAAAIADYDLEITIQYESRDAEEYRVSVRSGKVTAFAMDGEEKPANESYSIRGLFGIIERELDMASGKAPAAAGTPAGAVLRAEFDERHGYPRVFKRLAPEGRSCFITVKRFEPAPGR